MRGENLLDLVRMVVGAARASGQRLLLGVPPDILGGGLGGADIFSVQGIPHAWLFPRMRFILHHGGAGTTGAAAAAGVPSTAVPFSADQAFWARRLHKLGVGPAAPPARRLSAERLEAILSDALANPSYLEHARILGENIRGEDGVAAALNVIYRQLGA